MTTPSATADILAAQFHGNVRLVQKRPGIFQIHAPFYHEDGDMLDMYLAQTDDERYRISDYGKTVMRLSYSFELDTDNKQRIFKELLTENRVQFDESSGSIMLDATRENLCVSVLHFAQVVAKVSRLDILRREIVSGLFFEMLNEFIESELLEFNPRQNVQPLPGRDDLEAPWAFDLRQRPVYLFPVRNSSHARLATISMLEYQRAQLDFKGHVVHDDFDAIPANDRKRLTSAADKQFVSLDDFRKHAAEFLRREAA